MKILLLCTTTLLFLVPYLLSSVGCTSMSSMECDQYSSSKRSASLLILEFG